MSSANSSPQPALEKSLVNTEVKTTDVQATSVAQSQVGTPQYDVDDPVQPSAPYARPGGSNLVRTDSIFELVNSIIEPTVSEELMCLPATRIDVGDMSANQQDTCTGDIPSGAVSPRVSCSTVSALTAPSTWTWSSGEDDSDGGDTEIEDEDDDPNFWTYRQVPLGNQSAWNVLSNMAARVGERLYPEEDQCNESND